MKNTMKITAMILGLAMVITSCDKEGDAPEIDFHEIGMENSKSVTAGEELHLDAEIEADNKIETIAVELHEDHDHMKKGMLDEWEFDSVYTEFSGLRNATFHEHIDVPVTAEAGTYHFSFKVTDMEGFQTEFDEEVEVLAPSK